MILILQSVCQWRSRNSFNRDNCKSPSPPDCSKDAAPWLASRPKSLRSCGLIWPMLGCGRQIDTPAWQKTYHFCVIFRLVCEWRCHCFWQTSLRAARSGWGLGTFVSSLPGRLWIGMSDICLRTDGLSLAFCQPWRHEPWLWVTNWKQIDCRKYHELAETGDIVADSAMQVIKDRISRGLTMVISPLDPDIILIGGMLAELERLFTNIPCKWPGYIRCSVNSDILVPLLNSNP